MKTIISACLSFLLACQEPASNHPKPVADSIATATHVPKIPDTTTLGGEWYLQPVLASDVATGKTPSLRLDLAKKRFSGNTGCNNMNGKFWYSDKDSSLSFSDKIVTTRMACPGYNESSFLKSLQHANHYRIRSGTLTLLAEDNSELSKWGRKSSANVKSEKI